MTEKNFMKNIKQLVWITPLALLIAGCAAPVKQDTTISEWQQEGMLPPTGAETPRVYAEPQSYPSDQPSIIVASNDRKNTPADFALADAIRRNIEYDRGLAPSLEHVAIAVQDGHVILRGTVKSDLDERVVVDAIREIAGDRVTDRLEINPNV